MTPGEISAQLARILASSAFSGSERMSRFLSYAVKSALEGKAAELKESVLGVHVFDRPAGYDARLDPIVRVEARRLRAKLAQYYQAAGRHDPLIIELPTGGYVPAFRDRRPPPPEPSKPKTVAVLPFANLSTEAENQYFSDGLTRELIHELTRLPGLRVMAWNSVAQLREKAGQAKEVGQLLSVDAVLEGSVQRSGRRVRITAQLVEASTGVYLWSENYQREWEDVFTLQQEIARTLAMVLKIRLTSTERHAPRNPEAYNFYLQGRHAWNQRTEIALRQSISLFERALQEDPEFALAYAGVADSYSLLCDFGHMPAKEGIAQAREAAQRALELDPTMGEAHCSLGFIRCTHDWQWREGEQNYLRALDLNPGYATAHHWYGTDFLALWGRFPEAAAEMALARALDPLDTIIEDSACYLHLLWRRYNEAEQRYHDLVRRAPQWAKAYSGLGRVLGAQGRYAEAVAMMERAYAIAGDLPSLIGALGQMHALSGNRAKARLLLEKLRSIAGQRHVSATCFALLYLGLGEKTEALDWLEHGLISRDLPMTGMNVHPAYDDLRAEPRFSRILEKMGFAAG
ncbi:MAG: hypothetical protein SFV51_01750 [Bryobacteraceae bacterium]|nr:hypothetical protein [Bryobacteraceae bacterium]